MSKGKTGFVVPARSHPEEGGSIFDCPMEGCLIPCKSLVLAVLIRRERFG